VLHLGHLAQSVLASTQHFIAQDGFAQAVALEQLAFFPQQVEQQPVTNSAEAQTSRARTLMVFMMMVFVWLMESTFAPLDRPAAEQGLNPPPR